MKFPIALLFTIGLVFMTALLFTIAFHSPAAQAGPYMELGTGYNKNLTGCSNCWDDAGAGPLGAYIRVGMDWSVPYNEEHMTVGVHWMHLSQWFEGPPLDQDPESSVDHLGVYVRYEW
jgi:hypothetical protein